MRRLIYPYLENLFAWLAKWTESKREHFAICPHCGANRYTGRPCV